MFRPVAITVTMNGFVVTVGCQTVVVEGDSAKLGQLVRDYFDPDTNEKMEQHYLNLPLARKIGGGNPAPPPTVPPMTEGTGMLGRERELRARERAEEMGRANTASAPEAPYRR